jgi:hypothetical protein
MLTRYAVVLWLLNHNALYHLLQAIALLMIFVGVGWFAAHRTPA